LSPSRANSTATILVPIRWPRRMVMAESMRMPDRHRQRRGRRLQGVDEGCVAPSD
jgi:hypothetical protein